MYAPLLKSQLVKKHRHVYCTDASGTIILRHQGCPFQEHLVEIFNVYSIDSDKKPFKVYLQTANNIPLATNEVSNCMFRMVSSSGPHLVLNIVNTDEFKLVFEPVPAGTNNERVYFEASTFCNIYKN